VLHLLGYDHTGSKKKAEAMAKKEAQLLKAMAKED
jgi:ssRNA-specific RNase YbeY (16S rRNA maturation enzyme)